MTQSQAFHIESRRQVEVTADGYIAEASSIGLVPGYWPDTIVIGVGDTFSFSHFCGPTDDSFAAVYRHRFDAWTLTVYND